MDNKTQKSFSNWLFKINFYRAATKPIFSAQDDVNLQHMSLAIIISACPSSRRLRHENGSERRSWSRRSLTRERKSTWWIAWCPIITVFENPRKISLKIASEVNILTKISKMVNFARKFDFCGQTVLPDRTILIGQKLVGCFKIKKSHATFLIFRKPEAYSQTVLQDRSI